jgi:branched-chain amino acid transport system substrate-binding protein
MKTLMSVFMSVNRRFLGALIVTAICAVSVAPGSAQNTLLIGQSAGLTGGQAQYSKDTQTGIECFFTITNEAGGVAGKKLKLLSLDDQGKRDQVVANTKKLVEDNNVFALMGYTSGAGVEGTLAYLAEARTPMLSPMTGNIGIRAAHNRYLLHTRAGYDAEMQKAVWHVDGRGLSRFALVYLNDVGPANAASLHAALAAKQLKTVIDVPIDRNATDFSAQVDRIMAAKPDAVVFITNGPPLTQIVRALKKRGYVGELVSSSFAGTRFIDELKQESAGVVMVQVLPSLSKITGIPKEFKQHLAQTHPGAKANDTMFEAYISARVLVEGLRRTGAAPTRERFIDTLQSMPPLDLGGYRIAFSEQNHSGSRFADTGVVLKTGMLRY